MTVKSEKEENEILTWFKKEWEKPLWYAALATPLILLLSLAWETYNKNYKSEAMTLIRKDYPTLICISPNGGIRIYESNSYKVGRDNEYGWQVWWKDKKKSNATTFHISKCEIK